MRYPEAMPRVAAVAAVAVEVPSAMAALVLEKVTEVASLERVAEVASLEAVTEVDNSIEPLLQLRSVQWPQGVMVAKIGALAKMQTSELRQNQP